MNLKDKTVVITGATAGIGYQTTLDFARTGAFVIGVGRSPQRCDEARQKIMQAVPHARLEFLTADLSSQRQVRTLSDEIGKTLNAHHFVQLDVLVNNAGVYMGKKVFSQEGIETTFAVNHLAPFLLTHLLLPLLEKADSGRVITVSSDSHYRTWFSPERAKNPIVFFGLSAYKVSKLSNVLFSAEFNRLHQDTRIHAFAVDPGLVNTEIGMKDTGGLAKLVWRGRKNLGVLPEVPSKTILFLAAEDAVVQSPSVYWHECKPKKPSRAAGDESLARRLWIESCKLTGVDKSKGE